MYSRKIDNFFFQYFQSKLNNIKTNMRPHKCFADIDKHFVCVSEWYDSTIKNQKMVPNQWRRMSKAQTHISVTAIGLIKATGKNVRQEYQACASHEDEDEDEDKFIVTNNTLEIELLYSFSNQINLLQINFHSLK